MERRIHAVVLTALGLVFAFFWLWGLGEIVSEEPTPFRFAAFVALAVGGPLLVVVALKIEP